MTGPMWLMLGCGLLMGSDGEDAAKKEYARFEGVWSFALVEVDGVKQPGLPFESNKIIISKGGSFVVVQGSRVTRGVFTLDPTKAPKHYDQTVTQGPAKGQTFSCIYELEGDTYKLCGSFRGGARPAAFASSAGSGLILQVLKRENQSVEQSLIEVSLKELTGTWQALSYALNGVRATDEEMTKVKLTIDNEGHAQARREGKPFIGATTKIDPATNPMAVDFAYTEGDFKGRKALGIYKVEDDNLTICRSLPDQPRPTEFDSKPDSGHTLMTYKRETAPKK